MNPSSRVPSSLTSPDDGSTHTVTRHCPNLLARGKVFTSISHNFRESSGYNLDDHKRAIAAYRYRAARHRVSLGYACDDEAMRHVFQSTEPPSRDCSPQSSSNHNNVPSSSTFTAQDDDDAADKIKTLMKQSFGGSARLWDTIATCCGGHMLLDPVVFLVRNRSAPGARERVVGGAVLLLVPNSEAYISVISNWSAVSAAVQCASDQKGSGKKQQHQQPFAFTFHQNQRHVTMSPIAVPAAALPPAVSNSSSKQRSAPQSVPIVAPTRAWLAFFSPSNSNDTDQSSPVSDLLLSNVLACVAESFLPLHSSTLQFVDTRSSGHHINEKFYKFGFEMNRSLKATLSLNLGNASSGFSSMAASQQQQQPPSSLKSTQSANNYSSGGKPPLAPKKAAARVSSSNIKNARVIDLNNNNNDDDDDDLHARPLFPPPPPFGEDEFSNMSVGSNTSTASAPVRRRSRGAASVREHHLTGRRSLSASSRAQSASMMRATQQQQPPQEQQEQQQRSSSSSAAPPWVDWKKGGKQPKQQKEPAPKAKPAAAAAAPTTKKQQKEAAAAVSEKRKYKKRKKVSDDDDGFAAPSSSSSSSSSASSSSDDDEEEQQNAPLQEQQQQGGWPHLTEDSPIPIPPQSDDSDDDDDDTFFVRANKKPPPGGQIKIDDERDAGNDAELMRAAAADARTKKKTKKSRGRQKKYSSGDNPEDDDQQQQQQDPPQETLHRFLFELPPIVKSGKVRFRLAHDDADRREWVGLIGRNLDEGFGGSEFTQKTWQSELRLLAYIDAADEQEIIALAAAAKQAKEGAGNANSNNNKNNAMNLESTRNPSDPREATPWEEYESFVKFRRSLEELEQQGEQQQQHQKQKQRSPRKKKKDDGDDEEDVDLDEALSEFSSATISPFDRSSSDFVADARFSPAALATRLAKGTAGFVSRGGAAELSGNNNLSKLEAKAVERQKAQQQQQQQKNKKKKSKKKKESAGLEDDDDDDDDAAEEKTTNNNNNNNEASPSSFTRHQLIGIVSICRDGFIPYLCVDGPFRALGLGTLMLAIAAEWLRVRQLALIYWDSHAANDEKRDWIVYPLEDWVTDAEGRRKKRGEPTAAAAAMKKSRAKEIVMANQTRKHYEQLPSSSNTSSNSVASLFHNSSSSNDLGDTGDLMNLCSQFGGEIFHPSNITLFQSQQQQQQQQQQTKHSSPATSVPPSPAKKSAETTTSIIDTDTFEERELRLSFLRSRFAARFALNDEPRLYSTLADPFLARRRFDDHSFKADEGGPFRTSIDVVNIDMVSVCATFGGVRNCNEQLLRAPGMTVAAKAAMQKSDEESNREAALQVRDTESYRKWFALENLDEAMRGFCSSGGVATVVPRHVVDVPRFQQQVAEKVRSIVERKRLEQRMRERVENRGRPKKKNIAATAANEQQQLQQQIDAEARAIIQRINDGENPRDDDDADDAHHLLAIHGKILTLYRPSNLEVKLKPLTRRNAVYYANLKFHVDMTEEQLTTYSSNKKTRKRKKKKKKTTTTGGRRMRFRDLDMTHSSLQMARVIPLLVPQLPCALGDLVPQLRFKSSAGAAAAAAAAAAADSAAAASESSSSSSAEWTLVDVLLGSKVKDDAGSRRARGGEN